MHLLTPKERKKLKKYLWCKDIPWSVENKLWKKVEKYSSYFEKIPWIQCICVCNSLAMNACHENSDIDLFVITKNDRLWTARIWLTILTSLLRNRKNSHNHAGKFCLSFFVSEDEENLSDIAIKKDIYLTYWLETLTPIVNKNNAFEKFLERNKLKDYNKNYTASNQRFYSQNNFTNNLWNVCEYILKNIFIKKALKKYEKLWKPSWVIISDTMLKFHDKDKRREIRDNVL